MEEFGVKVEKKKGFKQSTKLQDYWCDLLHIF